MVKDENVKYVEKYSSQVLLCRRTLAFNGRSFKENTMPGQIRSLYLEWNDIPKHNPYQFKNDWGFVALCVANDLHRILINSVKEPTIRLDDFICRTLQDISSREQLSAIGKIVEKYEREMLFISPPKEEVEKFLDSCPYSPRLESIRKSLEDYINGKTDIITDL